MLARLSLAIAVSIGLSAQQTADASPITYDFTGTFFPTGRPADGISQINGSFTINADPPVSGGATGVSESGSDVSITVNAGGQVFNFANTAQNPTIATFSANVIPPGPYNSSGQPLVESSWYAAMPSVNPNKFFTMQFYSPGGVALLSNLSNFNYLLDTSSFSFQDQDPSTSGGGTITSIEQVATPEPSTLAVFAMLSTAALARRRHQRRCAK